MGRMPLGKCFQEKAKHSQGVRKNKFVNNKVSEEVKGGCASVTRARIPLHSMEVLEVTMVDRIFPCSLWKGPWWSRHFSSWKDPHQSRWMYPQENLSPIWSAHTEPGSWQELPPVERTQRWNRFLSCRNAALGGHTLKQRKSMRSWCGRKTVKDWPWPQFPVLLRVRELGRK